MGVADVRGASFRTPAWYNHNHQNDSETKMKPRNWYGNDPLLSTEEARKITDEILQNIEKQRQQPWVFYPDQSRSRFDAEKPDRYGETAVS
jgi:hypothetical protein